MVSRETGPPPPPEAADVFGDGLSGALRYASFLADAGLTRGLIGPREVPRLWFRHLLNCGVLGQVVPHGAVVADIGSGAGLPGIPLALCRPDLTVTLIEPLLRRSAFLEEAVELLDLPTLEVVRARAEDLHGRRDFDVVTSRAVAPLDRLLRWSLPLVRPGGQVVAMKGESVADELEQAAPVVAALGGLKPEILHLGGDILRVPTTVVRVGADPARRLPSSPRSGGTQRRRHKPGNRR